MRRRKLLSTVTTLGVFTAIAGCSRNGGTNSDSQTQNETGETDENEDEQSASGEDEETDETNKIGSEIFVEDITYSFDFSGGLAATVEVTNRRPQGGEAAEVNISIQAYNGETVIDEANTWQRVEAAAGKSEYDENIEGDDEYYNRFATVFNVKISEVSPMGDSSIDNVTETVIRGRTKEQGYTTVETVSGEEIRDRVDA